MSKQQRLDTEAAMKFASAMGAASVSGGGGSGGGNNPGLSSAVAAAAALQAGMLRMPGGQMPSLPAHLLPFSPLLYPYQMAMAQVCLQIKVVNRKYG